MISPTDDAYASLRLTKQKIGRAVRALTVGTSKAEALYHLDLAVVSLDDAMTLLTPSSEVSHG